MSSEAILPEAIVDPQAFQDGFLYGKQLATNDLAMQRATTNEALDALVTQLKLVHSSKSPDWYAGVLAGYRVRRSL